MKILQQIPPIVVWFVLVLGGVLIVVFGSRGDAPDGPKAARFFPPNTYLAPGDITQRGYTDRYVVAPDGVQQGERLRPEIVADQPTMPTAPPIRLLLSLPVPFASIVAGVNAGSKVELCGKSPVSFGGVIVATVYCDRQKTRSCSAIVEVPPEKAGDLADKALKDQARSGELHLSAKCQ